ncbi:unnamed protein product [Withania somnifera]
MKWLWKYANEKQMFWGKVIEAKYEEEDRWMTNEVTTPYDVSLWRSSISLWSEFKGNTKIKVNDGRKTRFWYDDWHEAGTMISLYPDIHSLVSQHQRSIAEMWSPKGWVVNFRRQINEREITRVADFFGLVGQVKDYFKSQRHFLDYAWEGCRNSTKLGRSWGAGQGQKKVENHPSYNMMDHLEGEKLLDFVEYRE